MIAVGQFRQEGATGVGLLGKTGTHVLLRQILGLSLPSEFWNEFGKKYLNMFVGIRTMRHHPLFYFYYKLHNSKLSTLGANW